MQCRCAGGAVQRHSIVYVCVNPGTAQRGAAALVRALSKKKLGIRQPAAKKGGGGRGGKVRK